MVVYDCTTQPGQLAMRSFDKQARDLRSAITAVTEATQEHLWSIGRSTPSMQQAIVPYTTPASVVNMLTVVQDLEQQLEHAHAQQARAFSLHPIDPLAV